ncbi:MAG: sensor histidine kinase [Bacteroidales bacterium]
MDKFLNITRKIARIRLLQHALFWLVSFRVLLGMFSSSSEIVKIDYIYTSVFLFTLMLPVYINLYLSIPLFLSRRRYLLFAISFILLVLLFSGFNQLTFNRLIDYIFKDFYFISYFEFIDIAKYFLVFLSITTLLKLSKAWFEVAEARKKLAESQKQKIENELLALKSQVNPHFMFNSLNNIYSLALKKSDETPGAIIKLGDILRYVIYDAQEDHVTVEKELKLIRDYVDLQKIRSRNAKVQLDVSGLREDLEIAPLLFLPLVENGFKHGIKGDLKGWLNISFRQEGDYLFFKAENNLGTTEKIEKKKYTGIGIENVRRRLEISYPGMHEFHIFENGKSYRVELKIKLDTETTN